MLIAGIVFAVAGTGRGAGRIGWRATTGRVAAFFLAFFLATGVAPGGFMAAGFLGAGRAAVWVMPGIAMPGMD
ncbi:MAG: hypothetical protein M3N06_01700 [Pseudomonadota bacterium]|nr:hypothetical protein [Pseudomonadota bacterium]